MKKEEKVYKTNTKIIKKLLILMAIVLVVTILYEPAKYLIIRATLSIYEGHEFANSNITMKLPKAYKEVIEEDEDYQINVSGVEGEADVKVNQEYLNTLPQKLYKGVNVLNGISMVATEKEVPKKTMLTPEELADRYYVLVQIYFEDAQIGEPIWETVNILGTEGAKVFVDIDDKTRVGYLIPLDNSELTIEFSGTKENVEKYKNEIEKIVENIKMK